MWFSDAGTKFAELYRDKYILEGVTNLIKALSWCKIK